MPYNPTVNDRSGEILGAYTANAAQTRAEGMQNFGNSIGEGLAAMGSGIAGGISQAGQQAIKYKTAAGMLDAYRTNADAFGFDMNALDAMEQKYAKDPDKLLGALTVLGEIGSNNMSMQRESARMDNYKDLADYKAALGGSDSTPTAPKYNTGEARAFAAQAKAKGLNDDQIKEGLRNTLGPWAESAVYGNPNAGNFWGP